MTPEPIVSGQPFTATLGGTALFPEEFLNQAQPFFPGGVDRINLVDLKATVHVRSGATGPDVVLRPEPISYTCSVGGNECDPENDLDGVPGRRGNTDCEPEGSTNACGQFYVLPISTDCGPGGVCARRGKTGPGSQCEDNDFCITGDMGFRLQETTERYTADVEGDVLFGWDDENTGAILKEEAPNAGTWVLPPAIYEEPLGPIGFRVTVRGFPAALECTMGVNCVDFDVECQEELASPTPNSELIRFPIQEELP